MKKFTILKKYSNIHTITATHDKDLTRDSSKTNKEIKTCPSKRVLEQGPIEAVVQQPLRPAQVFDSTGWVWWRVAADIVEPGPRSRAKQQAPEQEVWEHSLPGLDLANSKRESSSAAAWHTWAAAAAAAAGPADTFVAPSTAFEVAAVVARARRQARAPLDSSPIACSQLFASVAA